MNFSPHMVSPNMHPETVTFNAASFEAFIERHPQILGPSSHALQQFIKDYSQILPKSLFGHRTTEYNRAPS